MGHAFLSLIINSIFHCFLITATDLFQGGVVNICNIDRSNRNCNQRTSHSIHSQYQCTELLESQSNTICGCSSSIEASVIIIIDASNHTRDEWKYITLKWLELYYNAIYSSHPHNMQVYYMLTHGDFTLTSLNQDPSESDLATDSFMDHLNELSIPNACVAFKKANEWLSNQPDIGNDTAIIYYAKATPFAPSFLYKCQSEDEPYKLIRGKDIFAIKYHQDIQLNYEQRDIGEFAYEMSIFPNQYDNITITGKDKDYLIGSNNKTNQIASSIVAAVSDFVCTKGRENEETSTSQPTPSLIVAPSDQNTIYRENDCCVYASGVAYNDIETCNLYKIQEIEYTLLTQNCLFYCHPFDFYLPIKERNWDCITNYSLWVQFYHICNDLNLENRINGTMWNEYRWHCPICYNESVDSYKSICRSSDGKQELLDVYIEENCDCKDVTLFLVIIIEIAALLCILIGMFILWYRFNIYKVKQHIKEKQFEAISALANNPEEVILNDMHDIHRDILVDTDDEIDT